MRRVFTVLAVVAVSFLGAGAAHAAEPAATDYQVTDSWQLTYIDGRPTVLPQMEDDTVEVRCWGNSDEMTGWSVNDERLVGGSWERTDGRGIFVQPEFTGETETLTITVDCHRA